MSYTILDSGGVTRTVFTAADMISTPAKTTFTRPADTTAYTAGDLIANSTTAGSVVPLSWTGATITGSGGTGIISGVVVSKTSAGALTVRVHFLTASPTVTNGDNGALQLTTFDQANYIGFIDVLVSDTAPGTSGALGLTMNAGLEYTLASGDTIYAVFEALNAYTPTSAEVFAARPKLLRYS